MKSMALFFWLILPGVVLAAEPANVIGSVVALDKKIPVEALGKDEYDSLEFAVRFFARRNSASILLYDSMSFKLFDEQGVERSDRYYVRNALMPASRGDLLIVRPGSWASAVFEVMQRGSTLYVPDRTGGSYIFDEVKPGTYTLKVYYSYPVDSSIFSHVEVNHEAIKKDLERGPIDCGSFKFTVAK